jgi:hypothetical protein
MDASATEYHTNCGGVHQGRLTVRWKTSSLLPVFVVGALCLAASAPVAIRVGVEPLRASGAGTEVVVMIQVSPEDRTRIGANAMVRIELDGEVPPGQSPLWAVRVTSDGGARVTTVWPPGEHHLKVEIASPSGQDTGLWVGTVRIPSFGDVSVVVEPPAARTPVPEPDHVPLTAAPAPESEPAPEPTSETDKPVVAEAAVAEAVIATSEPEPEPSSAPASASGSEPAPEPVSEPDQPVVATAAVAGAAIAASAPPPKPEPQPEPEPTAIEEEVKPPEPEPEQEITKVEETVPPPIAEPLPATEPAPVVEPLRSEAAPAAAVTKTAPAPLPDDVAATYEAWADAGPQTTEMTVVVSRGRDPVPGLTPAALRLQIGKGDVPIVAIGDVGNSPLFLGVAVDLSPAGVSEWPEVGRALASLAERAGGGRGGVFVATDGDQSGWDIDPGKISEALESPAGGDLATLVITSLTRFEGHRGRTFLILVTDGRFDASKAVWSDAATAVDRAGVPILVLALWGNKFPQKARKHLQQIAAASGGRLFLIQAPDQLGGAVERYGRVIDAGVALRFQKPPGMKSPSPVSLKANDRSIEITAPRMIR